MVIENDLIFGFFGQDWTCMGQNRYKNHFMIFLTTERVPRGAQKCPKSAQIRPRWPMLSFRAGDPIFLL